MGSNSFGQNKIGHEFCLPKTDSSKFTLYKPTYFAKNLLPVRRQRKVSIPASLVSNNIKPGFHVVVPQLQHPNSQSRRLLGGHGFKNHDIPNSQFSKHANVPIKNESSGLSTLMSRDHEITKSRNCTNITESRDHKIAHSPMS